MSLLRLLLTETPWGLAVRARQPRVGLLTVVNLLRKAEVDEFQVSFGIYEDILWFQVSICDPLVLVEKFEY